MSIFCFLKIVKIGFIHEHHMLISLKDVMIAQKKKFLILFASLMNQSFRDRYGSLLQEIKKIKNWILFWCTCGCIDDPKKTLTYI
jgi:hypothetical protein